jgi:hypothetical protein
MKGVAVDVNKLANKMNAIENSKAIWLLSSEEYKVCPKPDFSGLKRYIVKEDFVSTVAKASVMTYPQTSKCSQWINGTTFMFIGFDVHIYFKFLSWFSLFNGIVNEQINTLTSPSLIIRLPETKFTFLFPEFEQRLFNEATVIPLTDFARTNAGSILCFEKIITTPTAFATNAFRCKQTETKSKLRKKCYGCNSRSYNGTRFHQFRQKVLSACGLKDNDKPTRGINRIVIQIRKPYARFEGDIPNKLHRVLENPESFVEDIKNGFPTANVSTMVAENMGICDQVAMVHGADVLIGIHGAGLVHLWWLQDHGLLFELVPRSQLSNPSFKMLATLTGRRYFEYKNVKGSEKLVKLDSKDVINTLKENF